MAQRVGCPVGPCRCGAWVGTHRGGSPGIAGQGSVRAPCLVPAGEGGLGTPLLSPERPKPDPSISGGITFPRFH